MDYNLWQKYKGPEALGTLHSICWVRPQNAGRKRRWEEKLSVQREVGVNWRLFNLADKESMKAPWEKALRAWPSEAVWGGGDLFLETLRTLRVTFPERCFSNHRPAPPQDISTYPHSSPPIRMNHDDHPSEVSHKPRYNTICHSRRYKPGSPRPSPLQYPYGTDPSQHKAPRELQFR